MEPADRSSGGNDATHAVEAAAGSASSRRKTPYAGRGAGHMRRHPQHGTECPALDPRDRNPAAAGHAAAAQARTVRSRPDKHLARFFPEETLLATLETWLAPFSGRYPAADTAEKPEPENSPAGDAAMAVCLPVWSRRHRNCSPSLQVQISGWTIPALCRYWR